MRLKLTLLVLILLTALPAAAQQATPAVVGQTTPVPVTATPGPDDPRLSICTVPTLEGFVPHILREGERLADLLTGVRNISVTQLAALNCLDDPAALPIGAVVWIPGTAAENVEIEDPDTNRKSAALNPANWPFRTWHPSPSRGKPPARKPIFTPAPATPTANAAAQRWRNVCRSRAK